MAKLSSGVKAGTFPDYNSPGEMSVTPKLLHRLHNVVVVTLVIFPLLLISITASSSLSTTHRGKHCRAHYCQLMKTVGIPINIISFHNQILEFLLHPLQLILWTIFISRHLSKFIPGSATFPPAMPPPGLTPPTPAGPATPAPAGPATLARIALFSVIAAATRSATSRSMAVITSNV
ncbi:hypothetical protein Tco_0459815 [Tanacetum coccineum]